MRPDHRLVLKASRKCSKGAQHLLHSHPRVHRGSTLAPRLRFQIDSFMTCRAVLYKTVFECFKAAKGGKDGMFCQATGHMNVYCTALEPFIVHGRTSDLGFEA